MARLLRDRLETSAAESLAGRENELTRLLSLLVPEAPALAYVHGPSGIGKSALLAAFAREAKARGYKPLALDGAFIEPTPEAFQRILPKKLPAKSLILIDAYEHLRLIDSWLRLVLLPSLGASVRIVIASRFAPTLAWQVCPGWERNFFPLELGPLPVAPAAALLQQAGLSPSSAHKWAIALGGHPLALRIAILTMQSLVTSNPGAQPAEDLLAKLAWLYLKDLCTQAERDALSAACLLRRVTEPLLRAMLPQNPEAWKQLRAMSFVSESKQAGISELRVHDSVRLAVAAAVDPEQSRTWRRAAWRHIAWRHSAHPQPQQDRWNATADMIYLVNNPVVREAFFPSSAPLLSVEPALPQDGPSIRRIAAQHESSSQSRTISALWRNAPDAFRAVRHGERLAGFYIQHEYRKGARPPCPDEVWQAWRDHLRANPVPPGQRSILTRRWLSDTEGEGISPVQAECWLDIKRTYLQMRPGLRRCYIALAHPEAFGNAPQTLGFQPVFAHCISGLYLFVLDFGPDSIDGWLRRLVDRELGVDSSFRLDPESRALHCDSQALQLSALEFQFLQYLEARRGEAVSREELLREVWGLRFAGGSNVVDALVKEIRKKLGPSAQRLVSVRGIGFRLT